MVYQFLKQMQVGTRDKPSKGHLDGLVQERRNSSALAMELRLSYTNPSTCTNEANLSLVNLLRPSDGYILQ